MTVITGDTHRDFRRVSALCDKFKTTKDDTLIVLGDAGINYFGGEKDLLLKSELVELPISMFCIHGNHERRPESLGSYTETEWNGGVVYTEQAFPSLLFAKDGEIYAIESKRCMAIGGAYSVDKALRLKNHWGWWDDEQPTNEVKRRVEDKLDIENWRIDVVLSHTSPLRYEPREAFLSFVDDSEVDKSTEIWLDSIEHKLYYDQWYCGHYHTDKVIDKMRFLFEDFLQFK